MLSKFSVTSIARRLPFSVRHLGGLTHYEKYERLRQLCCTSDVARRRAEIECRLRPRTVEVNECCPQLPNPLLDIRCKKAMILGGASAVGYEAAYNLLQEGVLCVIIADVDQCSGVAVAKKLCSTFGEGKAAFIMTDLRQQPSIDMAFREIYKYFGPLHMYVNCVGVYNETPQCWDKMVRTNLIGCVRGTLLAYEYFSKCPGPDDCCQGSVIVNVTSYGSIANIPSMPMFSAASNGISGLTTSFGQDFHFSKTRIRCVTLCAACTESGLLKNMEKFHYDRQWVGYSSQAMKCCTKQPAKAVGKAILKAVKYGLNGSVYVIKEGKYYRYAMPDYEKLMRQETILL
ncbi:hypothetical protein RUM43_002887 [Polyplax serrata]|uniref:Uncharacterized protein n=1 Tax=Polyplax serrata TaxID=468196 RepID=A0AAN8NVK0_POLSC